MNAPRYIPALDSTIPLRLKDGDLAITSSCYADALRPHWINLGPAVLALTDEEAIDLGDALIRAAHHRRSVLAQYQPASESGEAVPA